jgi:hypothetical protein
MDNGGLHRLHWLSSCSLSAYLSMMPGSVFEQQSLYYLFYSEGIGVFRITSKNKPYYQVSNQPDFEKGFFFFCKTDDEERNVISLRV